MQLQGDGQHRPPGMTEQVTLVTKRRIADYAQLGTKLKLQGGRAHIIRFRVSRVRRAFDGSGISHSLAAGSGLPGSTEPNTFAATSSWQLATILL
jgi:hypothetical protein